MYINMYIYIYIFMYQFRMVINNKCISTEAFQNSSPVCLQEPDKFFLRKQNLIERLKFD